MKQILFIFLLFSSIQVFSKGSFNPQFDPYLSAATGQYEFKDSYKGSISSAGVGVRIGTTIGPLFIAGDVHGQLPVLTDNGPSESTLDVNPRPTVDPWISYGVAVGIKTRLFSFTYTYIFDSTLQAQIRNDPGVGLAKEEFDYTYHGTGQKLAFLLHITKNFSIGAEIARYTFDEYSLDKATHVVSAGSEDDRDGLKVFSSAILLNYNIEVELK